MVTSGEFQALIEYKIKGKVIKEAAFRDVPTAMDFVKSEYWRLTDNGGTIFLMKSNSAINQGVQTSGSMFTDLSTDIAVTLSSLEMQELITTIEHFARSISAVEIVPLKILIRTMKWFIPDPL